MNLRIITVWRRQDVMVRGRIGDLFTDVNHFAVDDCKRGSIHEAVNKRRVGILMARLFLNTKQR